MDEQDWRGERLVELVRDVLDRPLRDYRDLVQEVALVDGDVRVVLRRLRDDDRPHAVRYSLDRLPVGPCTGEVCDTPDQWAIEVALGPRRGDRHSRDRAWRSAGRARWGRAGAVVEQRQLVALGAR